MTRPPAASGYLGISAMAAVLFYVLSTGPAVVLVAKRGFRPSEVRMIEVAYAPLIYACDHNEHVGSAFEAYFHLWGLKK